MLFSFSNHGYAKFTEQFKLFVKFSDERTVYSLLVRLVIEIRIVQLFFRKDT